jgi:hypothetical protein
MQGGTVNNPQTVYGSASDDPENYVKIPDDVSAAIEYTLPGSGKVDKIRWMVAQGQLIMGTYGSIQKLGASDGSGLSMENVKADLQVSVGVKGIDAILTNDSIVFVMRDGQSLREVFYDYLSDKFLSPPDITLLAEHIARGSTKALSGITDMAYQQSPQSILWAVRTDGQLLGMAYEKSQKVYGWFRWKTKGIVESVSVYTNDGDEDEIWVSVKRTINDVDYRYIEYFKPHEIYSDITQAFYVDSGLTFDGGAAVTDISAISKANPCVVTHTGHHGFIDGQKIRITEVIGMSEINQERTSAYTVANATDHTYELSGVDSTGWGTYTSGGQAQVVAQTLTGLDHLEGESVSIITDGAVHPNATVTSGSITLAWYGNLIHAGLYSRRILAPMPINSGAPDGTPHGRTKKISNITIDFYETWGGKVVQKLADIDDPQKCETIAFGTGTSPTLFSGFKDVNAPGEYNKDGTLYIVQDVPLPITINAITVRMDTYD